jgi:uncharacterized protein (TIGR03790 family)
VAHSTTFRALALLLLPGAAQVWAQTGENVLLVVNRNDETSLRIGEYYRPRRSVPPKNVCTIQASTREEVSWNEYLQQIEHPVADCIRKNQLREKVLYIVTTMGVPLKVDGGGAGIMAEHASVDSELALLYGKLKGRTFDRGGMIRNPFFMNRDVPFEHARFPIYLVTRLAAFSLKDVQAMIDRSLAARNRGKFVIDLSSANDEPGNNWLRTAAILLPASRVVVDETPAVLTGQKDVIAYASWGSNDGNRKKRFLGYQWLPGAIVTEYVSTNARTFERPPDGWDLTSWLDRLHFFHGSPQNLTADALQEGATGASGNVYEPYLPACVRPDYLLPAYLKGRNLAESFYIGMPYLSWQGIVAGDPLCSLGKP